MKVYELAKQFENVNNGDIIKFLKDKGRKISSHNQNLSNEDVELVTEHFKKEKTEEKQTEKEEVVIPEKKNISSEIKAEKVFKPDDKIACRSVTPWKVLALGIDKNTVYHWNNFGDVDYVSYRDLQALRRTDYITKPMIIIEDADLCYQWRRELGDTYKYFLGVEYPEEFFDKSDADFEKMLKNAPEVVKEVIKTTAMIMIRNENYPSVQKIRLIDEILGTCIKEFL